MSIMGRLTTVAALFTIVVYLGVSANSSGLDLTLDREILLVHEDGAPCSQLSCRVKGNSVPVNSVTVSKVKVNGEVSEILAVSTNTPQIEVVAGKTRGNGTLVDNSAIIYVDLTDVLSCVSDFITCEVSYGTKENQTGEVFTIAGPGKLPTFQPSPHQERENPVPRTVSQSKAPSYTSGNPYLSELWFLGDKLTKVEGKFETLSDRLESRLTQNMESVQRRAGTLENSVLERVTSVETDFSSRVSRLEDRVSSLLLTQSPDSSSDVDQTLVNMERRLGDVERTLDQINTSKALSQGEGRQEEQPMSCDRGMGFDVTKNYAPYVIMPHQTITKQILCDTHTDGGGWIIFQRRSTGSTDFYRDWTSYKDGFGSPSGDFWLGNEALHQLTDKHPYELRVDMRFEGKEFFAFYSSFRIENESNKYKLRLGTFSGTAGNGNSDLSYHNNMAFSTFDRENDQYRGGNCAIMKHGAWWYKNCNNSGLNGKWGDKSSAGVYWYTGSVSLYPYLTEMKIRRVKREDGD